MNESSFSCNTELFCMATFFLLLYFFVYFGYLCVARHIYRSWDSSVGTVLGYSLDYWSFKSQQGQGIFFFTTVSRPALGPAEPPIQWIPGALFLGVKQPECEVDHSPPSSGKVTNVWSYTSTPPTSLHGVMLS
jgi:hypothetical protein